MTFRDSIRRLGRGRSDRGYIIISALGMLILLTATSLVFFQSASTSLNQTREGRSFVESGQFADEAIQKVLYELNEGGRTLSPTHPTQALPETITANGRGFSWWVQSPATGAAAAAGYVTKLTAKGTAGKAARGSSANLYRAEVGSVERTKPGEVTYNLSPKSAWSNAAIASKVRVRSGAGVLPAATITGSVGVLESGLDLGSGAALVTPTGGTYLYGEANAITVDSALRAKHIMPSFGLDSKLASRQLDSCGAREAWVASVHAGRIYANGDTGCYSSMDFDVPTTLIGTGSFTAFVSGGITFRANVTAPTSQLNIITTGGNAISFNGGATRDISAFIYAPGSDCISTNISAGTVLRFKGSLACGTIDVAGELKWSAPIAESADSLIGGSIYNRSVWYMDAYTQPTKGR